MRILEVIYGGLLGVCCEANVESILNALPLILLQEQLHVLRFHLLPIDSALSRSCQEDTHGLLARPAKMSNPHWCITLPRTFDEFFGSLAGKIRKNFNRHQKLLERDFQDIRVEQMQGMEQLHTIMAHTHDVTARTYQSGLDTDYASDEMRKRLELWVKRGAFVANFLYLNGKVCAYQHILKYGNRAHAVGTAYDPAYRNYGIGRYIQLEAIKWLYRNLAVDELDFGFGDAEYKREICNRNWSEADVVLFRKSSLGILAYALQSAEVACYRLARRALEETGMLARVKTAWRRLRQPRDP